jgi:hypothetical protein
MRPPPEQGEISGEPVDRRSFLTWPMMVGVAVAPFTLYGFISAATLMIRPSSETAGLSAGKRPTLDCASPRVSWRADCQRAATSSSRLSETRASDDGPATTGSIAQGSSGRSSSPPQSWRDALEVNYSAAARQKPSHKSYPAAKPTAGAEVRTEGAARRGGEESSSRTNVPKPQGSTASAPAIPQQAAQPVRQRAEGEEAAVARQSVERARVAAGAEEGAKTGGTLSGERKGGAEAVKATRASMHEQGLERPGSEEPKADTVRQLFTPTRPHPSADVTQQNQDANPAVTLQRPESNQ